MTTDSACAPAQAGKPPLASRSLVDERQGGELERLFKLLASTTRLRLLHALVRAGEISVSELASAVGMRPQAVSNQLQRLQDNRVVAVRRDGSRVYYRVTDPCVPGLLDLGLCLLEETRGLLEETRE